jgi:hypothetical protein
MSDQTNQSTTRKLADQAAAIATLSMDRGAFDAALDAYLEADAGGFRYVLERQRLVDRCELICHWMRTKWCVITCMRLCGPASIDTQKPANIRRLAEVIGKIASDDALLQSVIEGVERQDADDFAAVVAQLEFKDICHYVCSWFCTVLSERVCRIVCSSGPVEVPTQVETVRAAAAVIAKLAAEGDTLEAAATAARAGDCLGLRKIIAGRSDQGGCHIICEWYCTWRCVLVCLTICRSFTLLPPAEVRDEVYAFAQAVGKLATQTESIATLADAVRTANGEQFAAELKRLGYERYCIQLCKWICSWVCEEFCICVCPPRSTAIFTKIGAYYYSFDVASGIGGSGLTNDHRAFYSTMRLNGGYAMVDGAPQIEYRFETVPTDAAGTALGTWTPVLPAQIAKTNIGSLTLPFPPFFKEVWVNNPAPNPHVLNITPSADGWISVPLMFPAPGVEFVPGSDLIELISTSLQGWPSQDETGVMADASANTPLASDKYYGIRMRLRNVGDLGDGSDAGTCIHVAIDNTLYSNVAHHTYWDGYVGANELAVCSVGIQELIPAGCAEITNSLTVAFTAAHPNLDPNGVTLTLTGPGGPYAFTLVPDGSSTAGNMFGTATPNGWTLAGLPDCAYFVDLSVNVLLTTGDNAPNPMHDLFAFCKHAKH